MKRLLAFGFFINCCIWCACGYASIEWLSVNICYGIATTMLLIGAVLCYKADQEDYVTRSNSSVPTRIAGSE